jgi:diguanylate cyclase (GGDEF)-like protein
MIMLDHFLSNLSGVMPETMTTRTWRADSLEERAKSTAANPPVRARTLCEGQSVEPAAPGTGVSRLRRLGAAVARAGRAAWSRTFDRQATRFEEVLHDFAAELAASREPASIEAALLRLARRIAASGRFELIRAAGEPAGRGDECGGRDGVAGAGRQGDDGPLPSESLEEIPLRCGYANHGLLRVHTPAARDCPASRHETQRRLTIACTLAACAFEHARQREEWAWGGEGPDDGDSTSSAAAPTRIPCRRPDVVHDATFLNAVLPFALAQARRHGEPVSLLCVQLDRLGAIRNLLGPAMVDRLVHDLAETVASLVRSSDIVARLDDDRVVALLVRARGDGALGVARTIGRAVAESGLGSPRLPGVSVSIGVAEFPAIARDAASLLEAADEAMSQARAEGNPSPRLAKSRPTYASSMAESPEMASCTV